MVLLLGSLSNPTVDLDLFHQMALAREIMAKGSVPWHDSFAYTPVHAVVAHYEWGHGMIAYGLTNAFGAAGIVVLYWVLICALGMVCYVTARRGCDDHLAIGLCSTAGILLAQTGFGFVRAQMYTYVFVALLLLAFDVDRRDASGWWSRGWVVVLVALFPVWVNLHGGCLIAGLLLAVHGVEQAIRRRPVRHIALAGLALMPITMLNPWGWHYLAAVWRSVTLRRPASISEWAPIWDRSNLALIPFLLIALAVIAVAVRRKPLAELGGIGVLVITAVLAVRSVRFLTFFGIVLASYVPAWVSTSTLGAVFRRTWRKLFPAWALFLLAVGAGYGVRAVSLAPWRIVVPSHRTDSTLLVYPVGAVDYLQQHRGESGLRNVLVPFNFGSYVMWRMGPQTKVSFDSRYDAVYPPARVDEDIAFSKAKPGWEQVLARYPTDVVLVPQWFAVTKKMRTLPGWPEVYADSDFAIFARAGLDLPVQRTTARPRLGRFPDGRVGRIPDG